MKKLILPALIAISATSTVLADVYSYEIDGAATRVDVEDVETDVLGLGGTYYFSGVDDSKGPLAEAAFLHQASSLSLSYDKSEIDDLGADVDITFIGVAGRFVNKDSGLILEAGYATVELEYDLFSEDDDIVSVGIGGYLDNVTAITVRYSSNDGDDGISLDYQRVHTLESGRILNVEASLSHTDINDSSDVTDFQYGVDFFFSNRFSVGGSVGYIWSDIDDALQYGVEAEYFFTNNIAVSAAFNRIDFDNADIEADTLQIGVRGRF